ncbi:MAG: LuxR C-terminal-related transcriptional regulator [Polyangiales bacterium]
MEDDAACAETCAEELSAAGWTAVRFGTAEEILAAARRADFPRHVLMDLRLHGEGAFDAISRLRACGATIVAFTAHSSSDYVFRAIRAGAVGYVLKGDAAMPLAEVLAIVESGGAPISASIARRVLESLHATDAHDEHITVTAREQQVLAMLARGLTYDDAGRALGISANTIRTHIRSAYEKLHVSTKAEAVAVALKRGWLD